MSKKVMEANPFAEIICYNTDALCIKDDNV